MDSQTQTHRIENLLTDSDMQELLGVSKNVLGTLRTEKALPFLKITRTRRLYLEGDVLNWLTSHKKVLNNGE